MRFKVLPLESDHWLKLSHAYGPAADVSGLLRELASPSVPSGGRDEELWENLWSRLCHQDDVYDASYAAVPHIVQIALDIQGPINFGFYLLPACIEVSRSRGLGPDISSDLDEAYFSAVSRLMECVSKHRDDAWDTTTLRSALAAQAVSKGHPEMASLLINLDDDLIARLIDLDYEI